MGALDGFAPAVGLPDINSLQELEWTGQRRPVPGGRTPPVEKHTTEKLTVTGLFAGIGGLEQGFRQAGHVSRMLCELDPLARDVLKRRFPDAEITTDITNLKALPRADVVTAGFPCQDL